MRTIGELIEDFAFDIILRRYRRTYYEAMRTKISYHEESVPESAVSFTQGAWTASIGEFRMYNPRLRAAQHFTERERRLLAHGGPLPMGMVDFTEWGKRHEANFSYGKFNRTLVGRIELSGPRTTAVLERVRLAHHNPDNPYTKEQVFIDYSCGPQGAETAEIVKQLGIQAPTAEEIADVFAPLRNCVVEIAHIYLAPHLPPPGNGVHWERAGDRLPPLR